MRWRVAYDGLPMSVRLWFSLVVCATTFVMMSTRASAWGTVSTRTLAAEVFFEPNAVRVQVRGWVHVHAGWISDYSMSLPDGATVMDQPIFAPSSTAGDTRGAIAETSSPTPFANNISYQVRASPERITLTFGNPQSRHQHGKPTRGEYRFEVAYRIPCPENRCTVDLGTWEDGLIEPTISVHTDSEAWRLLSPSDSNDESSGGEHRGTRTLTLAHVARLTPLMLGRGALSRAIAQPDGNPTVTAHGDPHRVAWAITWAIFLLYAAYQHRRAILGLHAVACAAALLALPPLLDELLCGVIFGNCIRQLHTRTERWQFGMVACLPLLLLVVLPSESWRECAAAVAAILPFAAWQWRSEKQRATKSETVAKSVLVAVDNEPESEISRAA